MSYFDLAIASLNGTIVLLILSGAGAYLAFRKILVGQAVLVFSEAFVNVLLPSLLYISILEGVFSARKTAIDSKWFSVMFPPIWGLFTPLLCICIGWLVVRIFSRGKAEAVQRTAMMTIAFGNAGNLPLLLLTALCDTYAPLKSDSSCETKSASLTSLFTIAWNIIFWIPFFSYIVSAPDVEALIDEELTTLDTEQKTIPERPGLLSPPFISIALGISSAFVPILPEALLNEGGALVAVSSGLRQLGATVVPVSSLIVGARLYSATARRNENNAIHMFSSNKNNSHTFGMGLHALIFIMRLVVIPFIGRLLYSKFGLSKLPKLVGVFSLIEYAVPSANSSVMAIVIASQYFPNIGKRLEEDVAKTVLLQFMAVPIILTLNTALALNMVFNQAD